jgi:hypothetical protein
MRPAGQGAGRRLKNIVIKKGDAMVDLKELQSRINSFFAVADEKKDAESYRKVAALLSEYSGKMRDHAVDATRERIQSVIHKLQAVQDIDEQDKELILLWVVGCVDDFSRQEMCTMEVARLKAQMDACWQSALTPSTVVRLGRLFEESTRVLFTLSDQIERKSQTERFAQTLTDLGIEDREFLIELLKNKAKQSTVWLRGDV